MTEITDPLGRRTTLAWDSNNNVNRLTEAAGTAEAASTQFAYNQNGALLAETDPLGRTTFLSYRDSAGTHFSGLGADQHSDAFVSDLRRIQMPSGAVDEFELDGPDDPPTAYRGHVPRPPIRPGPRPR